VQHNFGDRPAWQTLLGVVEEVGELSHAHLKAAQGIRGTREQHHVAKIDAVADIVIFLADYCTAEGIDLERYRRIAGRTLDPEQLAAMVRPKLGRMIMQALVDEKNNLSVMTLEPSLEQLLHNVLQQSQPGQPVVLEPGLAESLFAAMRDGARAVEEEGHPAVLVVSPVIRGWLSKAARYRVNDLTVLSYSEIPDDQPVKVIHTVSAQPK
jgi:hypothetical protein